MPDKRSVDELSIDELEKILVIKKREARQARLQRMKQQGRVIEPPPQIPEPPRASLQQASDAHGLPAATLQAPAGTVKRKTSDAPQFEDDVDSASFSRPRRGEGDIWRRFMDRSLLLLEVVAVIGLIGIGVVLADGIGTLQRETAEAQAQAEQQLRAAMPTIEPTPTLRLADIVLPGGHTPPTEAGSTFNFEEVPENLRYFVSQQIYPPEIRRPPMTPETARSIIIPALNIDAPIVQGVDWEALKNGVGQLPNNVNPAEREGNVVLAAHNDIYGELFRYLDQLEIGMEFQIQTERRTYTYRITGTDIVAPQDVYVMDNTPGKATATLISCYPYQVNSQRYIVFAERVDA